MMRTGCAAIILVLLLGGPASAEEYPILFVHGFCSDSSAWDSMFGNLPRGRLGEELVRLYQDADGVHLRKPPTSADLRSFTIDFYDPTARSFDPRTVADIPMIDKVGQLKAVIDQIKLSTRASKVIVVSHSMGGLVARTYVQGYGLDSSAKRIVYADDVARVITIDTPHRGSGLGSYPSDFTPLDACRSDATINKSELLPESPFLNSLNTDTNVLPWPGSTKLDAIVSYYSTLGFPDSDGVVTRESQDIRTISEYWARHPNVRAHLQLFLLAPLGFPFRTLHGEVLGYLATASRVASLVDATDRESIPPPVAPPTPPPAPTPTPTPAPTPAPPTSSGSILQNGVALTGLSAAANVERMFRVNVPSGARLIVTLSGGAGDADLYLEYGLVSDLPASFFPVGSWDCQSITSGNNEACAPAQRAGWWYVFIRTKSGYSDVTLVARY